MKKYKLKNGHIEQSFSVKTIIGVDSVVYFAFHKFNGLNIFFLAKDAYSYIRNNQLIINF